MPATSTKPRGPLSNADRDRAAEWLAKPNKRGDTNDALAHWGVMRFTGLQPHDQDFEDALQEARWAIVYGLTCPTYDAGKSSLSTYLATTMQRQLAKWLMRCNRHGFTNVGDSLNCRSERKRAEKPLSLEAQDEYDPDRHRQTINLSALLEDHRRDVDAEGSARLRALWARIADVLDERTVSVLFGRLMEGQTLDDMAERFGITRERVRQIQAAGLFKLRKHLECVA